MINKLTVYGLDDQCLTIDTSQCHGILCPKTEPIASFVYSAMHHV